MKISVSLIRPLNLGFKGLEQKSWVDHNDLASVLQGYSSGEARSRARESFRSQSVVLASVSTLFSPRLLLNFSFFLSERFLFRNLTFKLDQNSGRESVQYVQVITDHLWTDALCGYLAGFLESILSTFGLDDLVIISIRSQNRTLFFDVVLPPRRTLAARWKSWQSKRQARNDALKTLTSQYEELQQVNLQLEHLGRERIDLQQKLAEAASVERKKLARNLHDSVGQILTGISLRTLELRERLEEGDLNQEDAHEMDRLLELIRGATQQTRTIARGLSPVSEFEGGLTAAVAKMVRQMTSTHGPKIVFEECEPQQNIDPYEAEQVFAIIQEALTNAIRHSGATLVEVVLVELPLKVVISDNGCGFRPDHTGFGGLEGMRYRASLIDAAFRLQTAESSGCRIEISKEFSSSV